MRQAKMSWKKRLVWALPVIAIAAPVLAWSNKTGKLQGYDAVGKPGAAVKVRAKLERVIKGLDKVGINPDVEGETLTFFLVEQPVTDPHYTVVLEEAKYLGKAKTNSSGFAELDFTPSRTGIYKLEARIKKGSEYMAFPAPLIVGSFDASCKLIVADIDETLSDASSLKVVYSDKIKPLEDAVKSMEELFFHRGYNVIYITAQDDAYANFTKGWMERNKFPPGPIFFWDVWNKSWSEQTYKTRLTKKLCENLPRITAAVGDSDEDAEAFLSNGLTAHIIQAEKSEDLPGLALHAEDWKMAMRHLREQDDAETAFLRFAGGGQEQRTAAWRELSKIGAEAQGYLARFRSSTDLDTAIAARLVIGRYKARLAFLKTLDMSDDNAALKSLLTCWREGDIWLISQLYRKPDVAINDCEPPVWPFKSVAVVKREEPSATQVVYELKLSPEQAGKAPVSAKVKLIELEEGQWRIDTPDF